MLSSNHLLCHLHHLPHLTLVLQQQELRLSPQTPQSGLLLGWLQIQYVPTKVRPEVHGECLLHPSLSTSCRYSQRLRECRLRSSLRWWNSPCSPSCYTTASRHAAAVHQSHSQPAPSSRVSHPPPKHTFLGFLVDTETNCAQSLEWSVPRPEAPLLSVLSL